MREETTVAVINQQTGLVENIAIIKDGDGSAPAEGFLLIRSEDAAIGDTWDGSQIIKAPQPIVEREAQEAQSLEAVSRADDAQALRIELDALTARLAKIEAKLGL
jgi:hypothetical protein